MRNKFINAIVSSALVVAGVLSTAPQVFAVDNVTTNPATGIISTDATLNGTVGPSAATQESFWVSLAPIDTSTSNIPSGVYSTPVLPAVGANGTFSDPLSLVTTSGITTGGVPGNLAPITPNTVYYFVAWANVGGTWYHGAVLNFTTNYTTTTVTNSLAASTAAGAGYTVNVSVAAAFGTITPTGTVTVSEGSATCPAALSGSNGTATGSCLLTSTIAGTRTVTASYPGDANFSSSNSAGASHPVSPAAANTLTITTQPAGTGSVDNPLTVQPVVLVQDQYGNSVSDGTLVAASLASGSGALNGTLTANTSGGSAAFTNLGYTKSGELFTITFSSNGQTAVSNNVGPLAVGAVSASQSTVAFSNIGQITTDGGTATFDIFLKDQYGNPVPGLSVHLSPTGSNNTPTPASAVSDASGHVQLGLQSTTAETKTVSVVAGSTTLSTTIPVTFIAGAPTNANIVANPVSPIQANPAGASAILTITVTDGHGNIVPDGTAVVVNTNLGAITGSGNTVSGIATRTLSYNGKGAATLSVVGLTATGATTITFADSIAPVITLTGSSPASVELHGVYTDAGATASDNFDGTIPPANIVVGGLPVDANTIVFNPAHSGKVVATYTVTYDVQDSSGNHAVQVARTVNVVDTTAPVISSLTSDATTPGVLKIGDQIHFTLTPSAPEPDGAVTTGSYNGHALTWSTSNAGVTFTATYTVTAGDTDQHTPLQISGLVLADEAGNNSAPFSGADIQKTIDANAPTLTSVHISSSNANSSYAKAGDTVLVSFTGNEPLFVKPVVAIDSQPAVVNGGGSSWTATYILTGGDAAGLVPFTVNFSDLAGNPGVQVTAVTDASSVTFIKTPPAAPTGLTLTSWINNSNKTNISVAGNDATPNTTANYAITDVGGAHQINGTGPVLGGSFNITGISSVTLNDGIITASVTVTDPAGNVSSPTIVTSNKDTINPVIDSAVLSQTSGWAKIGTVLTATLTAHGAQADLVLTPATTCAINGVDVSGSFVNNANGTYALTYTVTSGDTDQAAGQLPISCSFMETSGNTVVDSAFSANTLAVDAHAPSAPVVAMPLYVNNANKTSVSVTVTGEVGTTANYTVSDAGSVHILTGSGVVGASGSIVFNNLDLSLFEDGTVNASATLTDPAGNVSTLGTAVATKDTINPAIATAIITPNTGYRKIGDAVVANLTAALGQSDLVPATCTINGVNVSTSFANNGAGNYSLTYTVAAGDTNQTAGNLPVNCVLTETAGNTTTLTSFAPNTVIIDGSVPTLTAVGIVSSNIHPNLAKAGDTVTVTFSGSETLQAPTVTIDGHAAVVTGGPLWSASYTMVAGDPQGPVTFSINFSDLGGNSGVPVTTTTDSSSVTFDSIPPVAPVVVLPAYVNNATKASVTLSGTGEPNATFNYTISDAGNTHQVTGTGTMSGAGTFSISGINLTSLTDGTITASVALTDAAGNIGPAGTTTAIKDVVAPTIVGTPSSFAVPANELGGATGVIYVNPAATDNIDGASDVVACAPASGTAFTMGPTTVACNTQDAAGNQAAPTTFVVTVTPAPIAQLVVSAATPVTTAQTSTVTVTGQDQYGNTVTNNSATVVALSADNGGSLGSTLLTLSGGVKTTTLNDATAGTVHVTATSGVLIAGSATVVFTPVDPNPPVVSSTVPASGATGVAVTAPLFINFNKTLSAPSITAVNIQLMQEASTTDPALDISIPGTISLVSGGTQVEFQPTSPLLNSASYYFAVSNIASSFGITMSAPYSNQGSPFSTAASTPLPTVSNQYPPAAASGVAVTVQPFVDFSETMDVTTLTASNVYLAATTTPIGATVVTANGGTRAIIEPISPLSANTSYHVVVTTGVKNTSGGALAAQYTGGAFTTVVPVLPTVISQFPLATATGVPVTVQPYVNFSEAMDATTFTSANVYLISTTTPIAATVVSANGDSRAVIQPTSPLALNTTYYVVVTNGVKDASGNSLASQYTGGAFTTAPDTSVLSVTGTSLLQSFATPDNTFADGWKWQLSVTAPTAETKLQMQFTDFVSGANAIPANTNIRFYSPQSSNHNNDATAVTYATASLDGNGFTLPIAALAGDLDAATAGRQFQVVVEVRVPVGTPGGSYSNSYNIQTTP